MDEQQGPKTSVISLEVTDGAVRCQIEGEHDALVKGLVALLVSKKEDVFRTLIDEAIHYVLAIEMEQAGVTKEMLSPEKLVEMLTTKGEA